MNIIMAFIGLGFLIFIHELGHYWVGRATGIRVEQFAIGFGPAIARITRNNIEYRLNWIPLGGYVKFLGEDKVEGLDAPDSFQNRPIWARFFTLIAGVSMNMIGAVILLTVLFSSYGTPHYRYMVSDVKSPSPAASAGFQSGDELVSVNQQPISDQNTLSSTIAQNPDRPLSIQVRRNQALVTLTATPAADTHQIGISIQAVQYYVHEGNLFTNFQKGTVETGHILGMITDGLRQLVSGHVPLGQVSGPVEIIKITGEASASGPPSYLYVIAILSVNLAVLNLLPFPALDGGRLVFLLIEFLRNGRRIPMEKEASINFIGLIFLFALMLIVTFKDVTHLFSGL